MSGGLPTSDAPRRRRSDARRSVAAIVAAANTALTEQPDSSMEAIAAAAGVTRQTVYAHFPTRDVLVGAIIEAAGRDFLVALEAARLDSRSPAEALTAFLTLGWDWLRRYLPLLLTSTAPHPSAEPDGSSSPVTAQLERIIERGQNAGDFDSELPTRWLADAILRLGHTTSEHVLAGRLAPSEAIGILISTAHRLCRPPTA